MKITDVKSFVVDCFRTNWVFVKVYTERWNIRKRHLSVPSSI